MEVKHIVFKGGIEVNFFWEEQEVNRFECIVQPGARMPVPHYHNHFDEIIYGKSGRLTVLLGGKVAEVIAGESIFIPRGTVHGFENRTKHAVRFLTEIRPGLLGHRFFEEVAAELNRGNAPDFEKVQTVMRRYGLVPVMGLRHSMVFFVSRLIRQLRK